jgi:hypothetical protein
MAGSFGYLVQFPTQALNIKDPQITRASNNRCKHAQHIIDIKMVKYSNILLHTCCLTEQGVALRCDV